MTSSNEKTCFVIAPIGEPTSEERRLTNQVLEHIIRPAVGLLGYEASIASEIPESGIITNQIIGRIYQSDLLIADLTGGNANVFYELAIRHSIEKPYVQILKEGGQPPFDVHNIRTIFYDTDLDSAARAKREIEEYVKFIEQDSSTVQTPISMFKNLERIPENEGSSHDFAGEILPVVHDIARTISANTDDIQRIRSMLGPGRERRSSSPDRKQIYALMQSRNPFGFLVLVSHFRAREPWVYELGMEAARQVMAGNTESARRIFGGLMDLVGELPNRTGPESAREYFAELTGSFDTLFLLKFNCV